MWITRERPVYPGQFIDDALLLQDLQLQKGYFLLIVRLIQVIQGLELLQRRMRADLLPLQHTHRETGPQRQPVVRYQHKHTGDSNVPTISRFSLARPLSFSSIF